MIETIVAQIIALLRARENGTYVVTLPELAQGLAKTVYLHHSQLYLQLPDLAFIRDLVTYNDRVPAVATVLEAWAYGVRLTLMIHRNLLIALPLRELSRLPVTIIDHLEKKVAILPARNISYADVVLLHDCWLLINKEAFITALARDVLAQRKITLIRQE